MLRVIGCITQQHDPWLVILAALLCVFASVTSMSMIWRTRVSNGQYRLFWLIAAGVVAGCGIWGTHFVAMLAFQPGFAAGYDEGLTTLSVLVAAVLCIAGFRVALQKGFDLIGGALTGAAIGAMHYIGMAALRIPATAEWDAGYVVASVVIGIVFSAWAMRVMFKQHSIAHMLQAAGLFTLAICGMHFTAMTAVSFMPDPSIAVPAALLNPFMLGIAVAAVAILIVGLGFTGVLVDHHLSWRSETEAEILRAHIRELETTKSLLENSTQNLAVALAQADAANRAKSQFMAAMSHELRTPLNAVLGFSEMMLREPFGPIGHARYRTYLADVHDSGAHLLKLINNVLDLSKIDSAEFKLDEEAIDISALIAELLRAMTRGAKAAKLQLLADIEPMLPPLRADRLRLTQVLTNLVANAVKFTPAGGSVRIGAKRREDGLALFVADTGIGISENDIPKAMDRFSQVDSSLARRYEGAGLGLPLAKLLTELHGGRLDIQSQVNAGTIVSVILPASRLIAEQEAA